MWERKEGRERLGRVDEEGRRGARERAEVVLERDGDRGRWGVRCQQRRRAGVLTRLLYLAEKRLDERTRSLYVIREYEVIEER